MVLVGGLVVMESGLRLRGGGERGTPSPQPSPKMGEGATALRQVWGWALGERVWWLVEQAGGSRAAPTGEEGRWDPAQPYSAVGPCFRRGDESKRHHRAVGSCFRRNDEERGQE